MSKAKDEGISFLKKSVGGQSTKTVSARVPGDVYASFQNAVDVAKSHGYDLSITDVVIEAMKMAFNQTRKQFGEAAFQTELHLSDKKEDVKPAPVKAPEPAKTNATLSLPSKPVEPAKK